MRELLGRIAPSRKGGDCIKVRDRFVIPGLTPRGYDALFSCDLANRVRFHFANKGLRRPLLLAVTLLLAACTTKPPLPTYGSVPNFQLTDQTGAQFSSAAALKGRVWVADFIFTNCPGPCPRMSSQMHQVQKALDGNTDARLISFTIDPMRDTPAVLAEYAQHFVAEAGRWYFLTGSVPALNALAKDAFHLNEIDGKNLDHSTRLALVDRESRIRGYYSTFDKDAVPNLIADARRLLKEPAE